MLPVELFYPVLAHVDRRTLITCSATCHAIQEVAETFLWSRISILRTFANNNPAQATTMFSVVDRRTGKYVKRLELSLWFITQWVSWEGLPLAKARMLLANSMNAMKNVDRIKLTDMDEQSAPTEIASLLADLAFPRLRRVYYSGSLTPTLVEFISRHNAISTLYIGTDGSNRSHLFLDNQREGGGTTTILTNLTALDATTAIVHTLLPLLQPNTPLRHLSVSFGYHGNMQFIEAQIAHLETQNELFTSKHTGLLDQLVLPAVEVLRLNQLVERSYACALVPFLPRFPNLKDMGHVLLSADTRPEIMNLLPRTLLRVHFIYEGVMWRQAFEALIQELKAKCHALERCELWAWSEAYHDLWVCEWTTIPDCPFRLENVQVYARHVRDSPAILWL